MNLKYRVLALAIASIATPASVWATNGMNIEGYGPIALGMGGASLAYDNGVAAVMNNPATLGMMAEGQRLDIALGFLGPNVTLKAGPATADSGGDAYYMPAVGWAHKAGSLTYGIGLFAQGGMGTEYGANTFMSMAIGNDKPTRSEVGVGRLIAPLAYNVNDKLTVAGSVDFVWAMMDIKMAATAADVLGLTTLGGTPTDITGFGADAAYLSFSDDNDFTGRAKGSGLAGKLGFTYKVSPTFSVGATYHSKTNLGDMKTGATATTFALYSGGVEAMADSGKITIHDFQWPETYGMGIAWQATPAMMLAVDVKRINWSDVMSTFKMTYSSDGFGSINMVIPQYWSDQTVWSLGVAYAATDALTLRAGANLADNPIPAAYVHPLFPAIVKNHYTLGFGYSLSKAADVNFALSHAPESSQTGTGLFAGGTVEHSQTSWQLMYSQRF